MFVKRCIMMALVLILLSGLILVACAQPAPIPGATPPPTTTQSKQTPLDQMIESAKKEASVTILLDGEYKPESADRLEKEIQQKFGVSLDIKQVIGAAMAQELSKAIMENKAGAPPSFDLMNLKSTYIPPGAAENIWEKIDWKPLLIEGTNPEVLVDSGVLFPVNVTECMIIMYNPQKVTAAEMPKTLNGFAEPKFKGKVSFFQYADAWTRWAWVLGKEKTLADIRAMMTNGAIPGRHAEVTNRFLLGEVWVAMTSTSYMQDAKSKGMSLAWQHPGFVDATLSSLVVRKGAKSPNSAKLIASYLSSPAGAKFTMEEAKASTYFYPGDQYDMLQQGKKDGLRVLLGSDIALLTFMSSDEGKNLQKDLQTAMQLGK